MAVLAGVSAGAYPRSHGGTGRSLTALLARYGLSPFARGNRLAIPARHAPVGPIPVRTGEPLPGPGPGLCRGAYPRSHGGTDYNLDGGTMTGGLSPFARGNQLSRVLAVTSLGPIPVRTGEPCCCGRTPAHRRAYPRSHGGTGVMFGSGDTKRGLSPFARGNRTSRSMCRLAFGPIPVRTGEPSTLSAQWSTLRAYPRSHGGTAGLKPWPECDTGLSPFARGNP